MNRRGFLAALLAAPLVKLSPAPAWTMREDLAVVMVCSRGGGDCRTLAEALKRVKPDGVIWLLPGHTEDLRG